MKRGSSEPRYADYIDLIAQLAVEGIEIWVRKQIGRMA